MALVLAQFDGLVQGYNEHADPVRLYVCIAAILTRNVQTRHLSAETLWLMNSDGDVMDIERMPARNKALVRARDGPRPPDAVAQRHAADMTATELIELISLTGHCSALIKWLPGEDLLVSHTTWDDYTEMLRVYKHYDFHVRRPQLARLRRRVS